MSFQRLRPYLFFLVPALISAACTDSVGADRKLVSLSFSTRSSAVTPAIGVASRSDITVGGGGNTLIITRAQLVLHEVELKLSTVATCSSTSDDDCEQVELGPMLVNLPLDNGITTPITVALPTGTYREIEFDIRGPGDDSRDRAFVAANPTFADASVRVEGTFNGAAFVYASRVDQEIELELNPPLVVDAAGGNATIQVDISSWFKSGATVISPATANVGQPNESLVRNNINASLKAIEDDDEDGR